MKRLLFRLADVYGMSQDCMPVMYQYCISST